tara:strand:- start:1931 stop:2149 length:219 start_codon:yes stop_codon:yes gene_type:complete
VTDEKNYTLKGPNNYSMSSLTIEDARFMAAKMVKRLKRMGWTGEPSIWYRDGTQVALTEDTPTAADMLLDNS